MPGPSETKEPGGGGMASFKFDSSIGRGEGRGDYAHHVIICPPPPRIFRPSYSPAVEHHVLKSDKIRPPRKSMLVSNFIALNSRVSVRLDLSCARFAQVHQSRRKVWQSGKGTVCWIGFKVAVLCAQQYMFWNIFIIKVLNNFWYFEHPILTMICLEAYL